MCCFNLLSHTLNQTQQCLLIATNAPHSSGWQKKNNIPYQQVKPLTALPTMKTLSPLEYRLGRFCAQSPTSFIDQIEYTKSMYLYKSLRTCLCDVLTAVAENNCPRKVLSKLLTQCICLHRKTNNKSALIQRQRLDHVDGSQPAGVQVNVRRAKPRELLTEGSPA